MTNKGGSKNEGRKAGTIMCTTGVLSHTALYEFGSWQEQSMWNQCVSHIKMVIADINAKLSATGREGEGTIEDCRPWLDVVYQFVQNFGKDMVPVDIQVALRSVEEGLDLPVTSFP